MLGQVKQPQGRMVIMQLDNLAVVLGQNPVGMPTVSLVNITIEVEWHWISMFLSIH